MDEVKERFLVATTDTDHHFQILHTRDEKVTWNHVAAPLQCYLHRKQLHCQDCWTLSQWSVTGQRITPGDDHSAVSEITNFALRFWSSPSLWSIRTLDRLTAVSMISRLCCYSSSMVSLPQLLDSAVCWRCLWCPSVISLSLASPLQSSVSSLTLSVSRNLSLSYQLLLHFW